MTTSHYVKPRETWHTAYDHQMALWRWTKSDPGLEWLGESYRINSAELRPDSKAMIMGLYAAENDKLYGAEPIFVSEEMCDVIAAAKGTFEPEPLYPSDLLTGNGFIYFEKPFEVRDRFDREMTIAGASWTIIMGSDVADGLDLRRDDIKWEEMMAKVAERDHSLGWDEDPDAPVKNPPDGLFITIYSTTNEGSYGRLPNANLPAIVPTHLTPWWFGMSYGGNDFDENGKPTGAGWWWKILQTTFRLMQQQISTRYKQRPDRATRRQVKRYGMVERDVTVVRLRRERKPHDGEPMSEANYSHRFIVGAHWRNQWYPASKTHRQIWINQYVKGDETLPLIVKPRKAFTWDR